jgi:hypothetical protein
MRGPVRIAPALAALAYPSLVWAGPRVSPLFLALALVPSLVGVVVVHRSNREWPRTTGIALFTVAAPALYSWLGGLLDFQSTLPFHAHAVWYPLWTGLALVAGLERPRSSAFAPPRPSSLAFAHGCSALVLVSFGVAHLANHLAGLGGGDRHVAVMSALRTFYRAPLAEAVLLAAVAFQGASGVRLLRAHAERAASGWTTAQLASGAYLGVFFLSHVTAVLKARWLRGIDTNWAWLTADSMLTDAWSARLAPYYALAVVAFGVHAGLGLRFVLRARAWHPKVADGGAWTAALLSTAASALILYALLVAPSR